VAATDNLPSWNDTATQAAITDFVARVTGDGPDYLPPEQRVATFDNDGTLWCEKPMPIQLDFIIRRFAAMAESDASLRDQQPWKAASEHDLDWLGAAMVKHYHGDDSDVALLLHAVTDGPTKPVRIWSRIGRRPTVAVGNSNGDVPMLHFAGGPSGPALRLLLLHDDPDREFDYTAGAEEALDQARAHGWTVISIRNDWSTVFPEHPRSPAAVS
jgi:hypothetical protein